MLILVLTAYRDTPDLHLSECQREIFAGWKRPHDLLRTKNAANQTHDEIDPAMSTSKQTDLVQDVLTDCSVVASLCATTSRSERGLGQVWTNLIPHRGVSEVNSNSMHRRHCTHAVRIRTRHFRILGSTYFASTLTDLSER